MNEDKSTEELLEELKSQAITEIKMTEEGVVFFNVDGDRLFTIPFAGKD